MKAKSSPITLEEMKLEMRKLEVQRQDSFIDDIKDLIDNLLEKANKKDYVPTEHEREMFRQIATIIDDMKKWF